jgi:hypothetical protein
MAEDNELRREVYYACVQWVPMKVIRTYDSWDYAVYKSPFVPGFHLCFMEDDYDLPDDVQEHILSTHKTLHEAMGLCRLLLANGGAHGEA